MNGVMDDTPRARTRLAAPHSRVSWFVRALCLPVLGLTVLPSSVAAQFGGPAGPVGPAGPSVGPSPGAAPEDLVPTNLRPTVPTATEPLADVRIEGNSTIPATAIAKYIRSRPGRPATQKQIREDVRALYGTRWFFSIEPRVSQTNAGPALVFRVVERPIVRRVEFRGIEKSVMAQVFGTESSHMKWIKAETGLKVGSPFDASANREAVRRIERYFKEKGYYFVKVELVKGGDPDDREVVFDIDAGPKVRVTGTRFVGNDFVSDGVLRLHLQTQRAWFWVIGGKYDPTSLPNDITSLKQYYFGLGFFDAQIGFREIFSDDKASVTVEYKIVEGPRFKIRNVEIQGTEVLTEDELSADFELVSGDFFNERKLNADIASVRSKYGELGRIFATVEAIPRYIDEKGRVDLVYRIDEDRPYRIRRINVNIGGDHPHTKPQVALNYINLAPGDLANPDKIDFARRRLSGIRIFDPKPGFAPEINITQVPDTELYAVTDVFRGQQNDAFVPAYEDDGSGVTGQESEVRPAARMSNPSNSPRRTIQDSRVLPAGHTFGPSRHETFMPERSAAIDGSYGLDSRTPNGHRGPAPSSAGHLDVDLQRLRRELEETPIDLRESRDRLIPTSGYVPLDTDAVFRAQNVEPDFGPNAGGGGGGNGSIQLAQARGINTFLPNDPRYDVDPNDPVFGDAQFAPPGSVPYVVPREVAPGLVDLDVDLNENQTGRLMFGVGVNSDAGVVGTISLQEDNFDLFNPPRSFSDLGRNAWRGAGQRFRAEAVPGNVVSRYLVSWTDPFIFGSNYSLSVTGFYFNRFYRDWDETRGGGRVAVGRVLGPYWSATVTYRIESVEVENISTPGSPTLAAALGTNLLQSFALSIAHDTRDSPFLPTEGHHYEGKIEQAFGDFDFTKGTFEARHYFTVYQRADGRGRHVFTIGGEIGVTSDDTNLVERFYAGGFQTFRGFDFRGVSPIEAGVRTGGDFSFLGSAEYKVPITADENLAVVAFSDFGSVDNGADLDNIRVTVGGGLRITVPAMGPVPLAFDFAVPVVQPGFDDERIFSFYIGIQR